jgi:sugar-specific transcriptional regulator TrmB
MAIFKKDAPQTNSGNGSEEQKRRLSASEAIADYCNKVADHLEATSREIEAYAKELVDECCTTAANLRQVGDLERQRTFAFYERVRNVITTVKEIREEFASPLIAKQIEAGALAAVEQSVAEPSPDERPVPEFLTRNPR